MSIKPIETVYRGYRFRSRLEARWAVFFDTLGLQWNYESEGYVLPNGDWYLPDFVIIKNSSQFLVEVKGVAPSDTEFLKLARLQGIFERSNQQVITSSFMLVGVPGENPPWMIDGCEPSATKAIYSKHNGTVADSLSYYFNGRRTSLKNRIALTLKAIDAARSARFEHGESGR